MSQSKGKVKAATYVGNSPSCYSNTLAVALGYPRVQRQSMRFLVPHSVSRESAIFLSLIRLAGIPIKASIQHFPSRVSRVRS